ncbi:GntR family transcriptional regulator [Microbacterium laevaniformans]|uniref:GntR family transcriptional regulator n=1 Tax=Microbacterium laevaniformans TaxID=36807 RepID=A0A4S2D4N5_9MICO|nr:MULTISPECIES: GntR family transcriptional regulator [Microbacterium]AXA96807.1 GntR family transcriptional regulator [Microbacterium sp. PM5]TGY36115.1 GntR family transcriptional regulator [Microbacterium laevaniformans]
MTTSPETSGPYERLRAAILSLDLLPGERLSERGLESMLGASRTPIRAALMRLENEGLTLRDARTWRVTPIDLSEIRALMEYREALETAVVALAVDRAEDADLESLDAIARAGGEHDDADAVLRDGSDFHVALARLSRNPFLVDAIAGTLLRLSRTRWLEVRSAASRAQAAAEHREIVTAVAARDAERARALVVAHARGTRDRLLASLSEDRLRLRGRGLSIVESAAAG